MPCEACGGDGQIEAGAYRGDDSPDTRECRLCGGVVKVVVNIPETTSIDRTVEILNELGQAAAKAGAVATRQFATLNATAIMNVAVTAEDIAREYAQQLNAENERQQRRAESKLQTNPTDAEMNDFLRTKLNS